jgi:outer membrane receptor protein involved in Fe transport
MAKSTAYEIGFAAEVTDNVALQAVAFSKEEYGLAGLEQGGVTAQGTWAYDAADTYGANRHDSVHGYWYDYLVIANRDRQVVHGLEISLQRRISGFWGASLNYTISTAMATATAPDLEFQHQEEEGDPANDREIPSEIDRPHVLNAAVYFRVGNEDASGYAVVNTIVRNTQLSLTLQAASGIPYTPTYSFYNYVWSSPSARGPRNSGRGPSTLRIDAFAAKDFPLATLRLGVFLRVVNLLDQRVCQQVFPSTGMCETGTVDQGRVPRTHVSESIATSTFFDRPQYYGPRRSFNFGLRVQF